MRIGNVPGGTGNAVDRRASRNLAEHMRRLEGTNGVGNRFATLAAKR